MLGLPASFGVESELQRGENELPDETFLELLRSGHDIGARNHLLERFMRGETIASLADGPIRSAMQGLGEFWRDGPEGILVEHRATEICSMIIQDLRGMVTFDPPLARAIGGATGGDPYKLPPLIAASVLNECGVHAVNLGSDTPIEVLEIAAFGPDTEERPDIVWLNTSSIPSPQRLREDLLRLSERCARAGILMCAGGREVGRLNLPEGTPILVHDSMQAFGVSIQAHVERRNRTN